MIHQLTLLLFFLQSIYAFLTPSTTPSLPPNVLLIVADDLGYNDLSSFGSPTINSTYIDSIGKNGVKFTQFYVGASICTPSRSSMLTGRLAVRNGIYTALNFPFDGLFRVFYPTSVGCLPESEITIAEALKPSYSTAMIGKWHLGHNVDRSCLPGGGNQGFDFFYGIPYSHEEGYPGPMPEGLVFPPVPLMTNGYHFVEQPFNESDLTSRYTHLTEALIEKFAAGQTGLLSNQEIDTVNGLSIGGLDFTKPFFMHLAYENPHVPLFLSVDYEGESRRGLFGDSVEEMDLSIGRILSALEKGGILDNTLIIFTSDNGAWVDPSNGLNSERMTHGVGPYDGGSNAPFFEGKGSTWEGGFRVPLLMSLPKYVPGGRTIRSPVTAMDFFPTVLDYAGISLPANVAYDGVSLRSILESTENLPDPHECVYLWREHTLYAIRCGQYKAHFYTRSGFNFSDPPLQQTPPLLFNVEWDPAERLPLNTTLIKYAKVVSELQAAADEHVNNMVFGPSEYLAQNYSRVPCCPRGSLQGRPVSLEAIKGGLTGPWEECICKRITL